MFDGIKQYITNGITYTKLEIIEAVSKMISASVFGILVGIFGMIVLFIASLAFGYLLGNWFGDNGLGFSALAGLYIILFAMIILLRKKIMVVITDKVVEAAADTIGKSDD